MTYSFQKAAKKAGWNVHKIRKVFYTLYPCPRLETSASREITEEQFNCILKQLEEDENRLNFSKIARMLGYSSAYIARIFYRLYPCPDKTRGIAHIISEEQFQALKAYLNKHTRREGIV